LVNNYKSYYFLLSS